MGQSEPMRIPARMPPVRDGRPLKRWRYVGVYGEDLMLCAGIVRVAGVPQCFWAVWDRGAGVLRERTRLGPARRRVVLPGDAVRVRDRGVAIDLALDDAGEPIEVTSPHGRSFIWTRKRPVHARGTVVLDGR